MTRRPLEGLTALILVVCWVLPAGVARAGPSPEQTVQTGTDSVLRLLQDRSLDQQRRRQEIRKIVDRYFDFYEMGRRVLGPSWRDQSAHKQQEFVEAFSQLLFNVYIDKIEKYTDEKISYVKQTVQDRNAVVDARILSSKQQQILLQYRLRLKPDGWKVYDVVIEGISLVSNYRSQIASLLATGTIDDVIGRLREKDRQFQTGSRGS